MATSLRAGGKSSPSGQGGVMVANAEAVVVAARVVVPRVVVTGGV